jgi:hypothetical protein
MEMIYDRLDTSELRGTTQADYLIALDADLRVLAGHEAVCEEPGFPVVELARSLRIWLADPNRGDFEFDSMSFEEVGSIAFRQTAAGWVFGSVFAPDGQTVPLEWADVELCSRQLISRVEEDLARLGLNPREVLKP